MARKANINVPVSGVLMTGLIFIAAGASVPSEETVALGFFLLLSAIAVLIGVNWPKPRPNNLVSMAAFRAQHRPHG